MKVWGSYSRNMSELFQSSYVAGNTPWDIGEPQSVFVNLFEEGAITGRAFDAGCGTGENALYLASRGLDVVGFDFAPAAIERARAKAAERNVHARFEVVDVLDLSAFDNAFDSGIDSGCFHVFDDEPRARYVRSLHGALRPQGRMFIMCFSDRQPGVWGPRRVTEHELRDAFAHGWRIDEIRRTHFDVDPRAVSREIPESAGELQPIEAWLTQLTRL